MSFKKPSFNKDVVTGIVYTRNTQRALVPAGPDGPLGDTLIVSGQIFRKPNSSSSPIGTFDIVGITTSVGDNSERRELSVELSFDKKYAKRSWIADLKGSFHRPKQPAAVSLSGVETFPFGGGLLDRPMVLGVDTGTGPFIGITGTASITYNPSTQLYQFIFDVI